MNIDWQTIVSLPIVALAAGYVLKHAWLTFRQPEESSCSGCVASKSCGAKDLKLVQLGGVSKQRTGRG